MAIDVQCPDCRKQYRVKDKRAGTTLDCKQCGATMSVPNAEMQDNEDWGDYDPDPISGPSLPKRRKAKGTSKKKSKPQSTKPSVGKRLFAIIGMALGGLIVAGSIYAMVQGKPRAVRGIFTGCVIFGVSLNWFRGIAND